MAELSEELERRIALLASDRESGASDILDEVIRVLREARTAGVPIAPVAKALCHAQPSMASVWNASLEAVASDTVPERFERFAQHVARSPKALARSAVACFAADAGAGALRLVTLSFSRSVAVAFDALRRVRPIRVACSESRPALEGRRLASRLAAAGVAVTCFSDAAIAHALADADAMVVGADAISAEWFLNKTGTRMLAAAAAQLGVPVYVVATRDKFVSHAVAARLVIREGTPGEIWSAAPAGVEVRNPYFESTSLDVVTGVMSDLGLLGAGMVPEVCASRQDPVIQRALEAIS